MSSVFITGCSRGLGLEFVKQLLVHDNAPNIVIATCRDPSKAQVSTVYIENMSMTEICMLMTPHVKRPSFSGGNCTTCSNFYDFLSDSLEIFVR